MLKQHPPKQETVKEWKPIRNFKRKITLTEDERYMVLAAADLMQNQGWVKEELGNTLDLFSNHCAVGALQVVGPDTPLFRGAYPVKGTLTDTVTRKLGHATGLDRWNKTWEDAGHSDLYTFNDKNTKAKVVQFFYDVAEFAPHEEEV